MGASNDLTKLEGNYLFWYWLGSRYLIALDDPQGMFIKDKVKLERILRLWSIDKFIWEEDDIKGDLTTEPMAEMILEVSIAISKLRLFYQLFYGVDKGIPELFGILFLDIIPKTAMLTSDTFVDKIDFYIAKNIWDYKAYLAVDYLQSYPNKFLEGWVSGKKHRTKSKKV